MKTRLFNYLITLVFVGLAAFRAIACGLANEANHTIAGH
jgi:hypothetical protein